MNKEDKKLQKHLVDEMMKVSETNPDVMFYMEALMEYCLEKEKEIERLNNIINELEKWCDIQFQIYKDLDKVQDSRISCHYLRMKDKLKELKEGK